MPPKTSRIGVLAFAKQSAEGTAAAAPVYSLPKSSGGMRPVQERDDLPLTQDTASRAGQFIQRGRGEGTVTLLSHPDALGLLVYEAMGAQAISGAAVPFTHVFTLADDFPLPLTVWDLVGNDWWMFTDTFVTRITIRGASGDNVWLECEMVSKKAERLGAAPTYTLAPREPRYKYIGSAVQLDSDSATPVTVTNVESCELEISRSAETRYGASLQPSIIIPVTRDATFSCSMIFDDTAPNQGWDYMTGAYLNGASTGTLNQSFQSGSFHVTFGRHPADATRALEVLSGTSNAAGVPTFAANWEYTMERPESDPGGSPIEFDVTGIVRANPGSSEVAVIVRNEVAAVY